MYICCMFYVTFVTYKMAGGCCTAACMKGFIRDNLLMVITLLSVVLGFAIGFGIRETEISEIGWMWLGKTEVGDTLFPTMLKQ